MDRIFYSGSLAGFFNEGVHGARFNEIDDPAWVRPVVQVADPSYVGEDEAPLIDVPDMTAAAPKVAVANPDCLIPADAIEISEAEHAALLQAQCNGLLITAGPDGKPVAVEPPPPTNEQIIASLKGAVQQHMDERAAQLGYDSIASAVSYADEPAVPKFQAEGKAFRAWRSLVWAACYAAMADVLAGKLPVPTAESLIASLPPLALP